MVTFLKILGNALFFVVLWSSFILNLWRSIFLERNRKRTRKMVIFERDKIKLGDKEISEGYGKRIDTNLLTNGKKTDFR